MKRNSTKILIFSLLITTMAVIQCLGPNKGQWTLHDDGISESVQIIDEWQTIDAKWKFEDGGKLTITNGLQVNKAYWTEEDNTLVVIMNGEKTVYDFEVLSETKLKLYTSNKEIILQK